MNSLDPDFDTSKLTQQLLNAIQSSHQFAYAALSSTKTIHYLSPNLRNMLNVPDLHSFIGKPITDLFGEFVGADSAFSNLLIGKRQFYQLENVARKQSDGRFSYITLQLILLDKSQPEAGFLLSIENSTEIGRLQQSLTQQRNELKLEIARREKAEQALQQLNDLLEQRVKERTAELAKANEQLRLLEAAIVNTSDTVIITESKPIDSMNAGIVYVNKAFTQATGYSYKEIIGQTQQVFHGPNTDPGQLEKIREALLDRKAIHVELINYRKDGSEFWADMTVAPIFSENDELTHFVSIERDATERKKLEHALLQAQKMEAIGLLAGGIAHDFNNVLTVIISYSDLLLRRFHSDPQVVKYVKPIHAAGKRASDLTYQLLAFSRQQVLQSEDINLNEIITEVEMMIRRPIGEDIQFTTLLTPDLWHIEADPGQLSQVIMNLSVNARDAMPQGGSLTIKTENITLVEKEGRIRPELNIGDYVRVTVSDSGKGMDNDTIKRIFDPFFTTKELGKGTGLGLSTVYGIIAQSQGGIAVQSEMNSGTKFEIYLPRTAMTSSHQEKKAMAQATERSAGSETILLVEDDKNVRELVEEGLKTYGYQLLIASDGSEALELCQKQANSIDILLTDVVMPGISGHDLATQLQVEYPGMKILYMTGYTDTVIGKHGVLDGTVEVLQKPFTIGHLISRIYKLLTSE